MWSEWLFVSVGSFSVCDNREGRVSDSTIVARVCNNVGVAMT